MSQTLPRSTKSRRLVSVLLATMFGLTLAVAPATEASATSGVSVATGRRALHFATLQYGIPYVWGGTTRHGFDCSGMTQYVYGRLGKHLPRTAQQQYNATIKLRPHMQRAGDLVFFYSGSSIFHEGIYAGNGYMINAAHTGTRVRMQKIWTSHVYYGRVK